MYPQLVGIFIYTNPNYVFDTLNLQLQYDCPDKIMGAFNMGQLKSDFGKRVQTLRTDTGMTQEELANATDLTVETISNIERGVYGAKFDTIEKAADALNLPVKKLFEFGD